MNATAIDVYTREFYFWIIPLKTALNFKKAMLIIIKKFGYKIKSILCDNGTENYAFKDEEFQDIQIFSCNHYASYQKALIEQKHNQLSFNCNIKCNALGIFILNWFKIKITP